MSVTESEAASSPRAEISPAAAARSAGLQVTPRRRYGRWVTGALVLVLLALLINAFAHSQIDWHTVGSWFTRQAILLGIYHTILITVLSMALGMILGIVFAVMRLSTNPVTSGVAWLYVWFFRGTPVLVQILLWFNIAVVFEKIGIPGVFEVKTISVVTPLVAAVLGLGVNEGSYLTETIRGGILSVDEGQQEAAMALGLSPVRALRDIVLPQAMRVVAPTLGNETIGMLKTSSLASVIGYTELLNQVEKVYFVNARVIEMLLVASAWYLIATSVLSTIQYYIERRLGRGLQRARPRSSVERAVIYLARRCAAAVRERGHSE
jgi:polar amino acid transport system permease protein